MTWTYLTRESLIGLCAIGEYSAQKKLFFPWPEKILSKVALFGKKKWSRLAFFGGKMAKI